MQNNVNYNMSWYEGHTIISLDKILKFSTFYVQFIWQVVRWWHHQITHLHIHIDWSRNVLWKFAKLQSVITSLFFNRFASSFHCYVWKNLLFLVKFKLNLFRIPPLKIINVTFSYCSISRHMDVLRYLSGKRRQQNEYLPKASRFYAFRLSLIYDEGRKEVRKRRNINEGWDMRDDTVLRDEKYPLVYWGRAI